MSSSKASANNIAVLYSQKASVDMVRTTSMGFAKARGILKETDELKGKKGSQINFSKVAILGGIGTGSTQTLVNREEAINNGTQSMVVNEFCHAVLNPTDYKIEAHETNVDFPEISAELLSNWMASRKDASFLQQLAGAYSTSITVDGTAYSGSDRLYITGHNTIIAPSSNRIVRPSTRTTDQDIISSETCTLDLLDKALLLLASYQPVAKPDSEGYLHWFVSPEQAKALIQDTSGKSQLYQIGLNEIAGGGNSTSIFDSGFKGNESMVFIGRYRNVKIWQVARVAKGVNSSTSASISTVQRSVLCGQNSATYASFFGSFDGSVNSLPVKMGNQLQDYGRFKGVSIHSVDGIVKNQQLLQSGSMEDQAVVVISTYGA